MLASTGPPARPAPHQPLRTQAARGRGSRHVTR
jgi:hypothetical protein